MKTKHILILLALALTPLHAQSLIPKTDGQVIAERVDEFQQELIIHNEPQLRQFQIAPPTPEPIQTSP